MGDTYDDLTNKYPDVEESDVRYDFQTMDIESIPRIIEYQNLLTDLYSAYVSGDASAYDEKVARFTEYINSEDYITYVEPHIINEKKLQLLEDKVISTQRFAKRQKQQWSISDTAPEDNAQAVDDIWFRIDSIENGIINATPFYKDSEGYKEFALAPKLTFSSNSEIDKIYSNKTLSDGNALINNTLLQYYKSKHDGEFNSYKSSVSNNISSSVSSLRSELKPLIDKNSTSISNLNKNVSSLEANVNNLSSTVSNLSTRLSTAEGNITTLSNKLATNVTADKGSYSLNKVIGGQETQDHTISFNTPFSTVPNVLASAGNGAITVTVINVINSGFTVRVKNTNLDESNYLRDVVITWTASAKTA